MKSPLFRNHYFVQTTIFLSVICVIGAGKSDARLLPFLRVTQQKYGSELGHPHPSSPIISTESIKSDLLQPARVQWSPHAASGRQYTQGVVADLHHQPKHAGFRRRSTAGRDESMSAPSTRSAQAGFYNSAGDMTRFQEQRPHNHDPYEDAYRFVPSGPDPLHNK